MASRAKLLCLGSVLPGVVLAAHGCRAPTQVTLELGTNVACADMRGADIFVAPGAHSAEERAALITATSRFPSATSSNCDDGPAPRRIGTLVLTPSGGSGAVVVVAAFGKATTEDCKAPSFAAECIVARRQFSFIDHTAVTLPIVLDPVCAGVPCNENSTCVGKRCVDSKVDCSSGTCGEPGVVGPDGGLIEEDAASPLVDAAPPEGDASADGAADASDAATPADGGDGGTSDGGPPRACPAVVTCVSSPATTCTSPALSMCCYGSTPPPVCTAGAAACAFLSGCCRDSTDCAGGDICCASTNVPTNSTNITCKTRLSCQAGGGVPVCNTPGNIGCGPSSVCFAGKYSSAPFPDYFSCS
jgi:hypothetical protein